MADPNLNTLIDFRYRQHFKGARGENGMRQERTGKSGGDVVLKLPVGTQILAEDGETLLFDLDEPGQTAMLAKGGDGGRGNVHFKSSTNRAPRRADPGYPGEERWVWLRLKLLADAGLVGLPNAGKSTFLSVVSARQAEDRRLPVHDAGPEARHGRARPTTVSSSPTSPA